MRIRVMKTDRTIEAYLHTKVLGTFHHALSAAGHPDLYTAEQMAEAVTFYLYSQPSSRTVTTDEIHLMVQAVLRDTGHVTAAEALNEHRIGRRLQRKRMEAVDETGDPAGASAWSKSVIVDTLMKQYHLNRPLARVIAGSVEEKVIRMGISRIRKSLIRELADAETETMLRAEEQLKIAQ